MRVLFEWLFGEYVLLASVLFLVAGKIIVHFFWDKKHRNWKLYKKIKGEKAERASEWLEGPEHPKSSIFPDIPPEDEPKE